jgi:UDP-2-acetamido-3-amino-2,3-dideoxy-glucuronate N-acetyltransferase
VVAHADARIATRAMVDGQATVGAGASIWDLAVVGKGAVVGAETVIGRGAFVDSGVMVGERCKIQNDALLYSPARIGDGVFVGPAVVLTNDLIPRAVNPDGSLKSGADWTPVAVQVRDGASIGARAVCVAPVVIGEWALVAAGAVVVQDVAAHALVVGVPARQVAWVGRSGHRLVGEGDGRFTCPVTGETYTEVSGALVRDA